MGRILDKILGRKADDKPQGESPVIPAHGPALPDGSPTFPNGIRMAIVDVDGVTWELIGHPDDKLTTFRHLDDRETTKGPVFQLDDGSIAEAVLEIGTLLHPKKLEQIRKGAWLDGLNPGTYFAAVDSKDAQDKRTGERDTYTLPYGDLIRFLLKKVADSSSAHAEGFTDVSGTSSAHGEGDGGRTGEQSAGSGAGASGGREAPGPQGARGGEHQP